MLIKHYTPECAFALSFYHNFHLMIIKKFCFYFFLTSHCYEKLMRISTDEIVPIAQPNSMYII